MGCDRKIGPFDCCTVVQGDCLGLMKQLPEWSIDSVITDPPYGNGSAARYGRTQLGLRSIQNDTTPSAYMAAVREAFFVARRDTIHCFFAGWRAIAECLPSFETAGFTVKQLVVWDKTLPSLGMGIRDQHEFLIVAKKGAALENASGGNVWRVCRPCGDRPEHPHEKPLELMNMVLALVPEAGMILDPFCGSGSTLVAAKKLGRHFLGFEISPEYCEIARKRIAAVEAQPTLFQPKPEQMEMLT
jgi:adenine-specific DNA-methyltransferase